MNDAQVYAGATIVGAISGVRSMGGTTIVSQLAKASKAPLEESGIKILENPITSRTIATLALGEVLADKLPFIPSRTAPISLAVRAITGAVAGGALSRSKKRSLVIGGI